MTGGEMVRNCVLGALVACQSLALMAAGCVGYTIGNRQGEQRGREESRRDMQKSFEALGRMHDELRDRKE